MQRHIILLGCGQMGQQILEQVKTFKDQYLVVDHDNTVIKNLIKKGVHCIFGDIEDPELLQELDLEQAEMVISTLPNVEVNLFLIRKLKEIPVEKRPILITLADSGRIGLELFNEGADYVILKPYLGAQHIHAINRELYSLEEESITPATDFLEPGKSKSKFKGDYEYAKLLHNLNKLRLTEIKQKIKKEPTTDNLG